MKLQKIEQVFEGNCIAAYLWKGQPVWVAKEVGQVMGYRDEGRGLVDQIRQDWKEDMIEGTDFEVLEGERLTTFKANCAGNTRQATPDISPFAPSLLLLKEPGFYLVCIKTDKPVGRRLRRWLAEEVMPSLLRTGGYQAASRDMKTVFESNRADVLEAMAQRAKKGSIQATRLFLAMSGESTEVPKLSKPTPRLVDVSDLLSLVSKFIVDKEWVQVSDVLRGALQLPEGKWNRYDEMRASAALKQLGWSRARETSGEPRRWGYAPKRGLRNLS